MAVVDVPSPDELGEPPALPETVWFVSHGVWDEAVVTERPSSVRAPLPTELTALAAANYACVSPDDAYRTAGVEDRIGYCSEAPWCQWALPKAMGAAPESREKWAVLLVGCVGGGAAELFGPNGGLPDDSLVYRAKVALWDSPVYLTPTAIRMLVRDDETEYLDLIRAKNHRSIDADIWQREVRSALSRASTLADRSRLGRALGGFPDRASIEAWRDGCDPDYLGCQVASANLPAPGPGFDGELCELAAHGPIEFRRVVAQLRLQHPDAPIRDAMLRCFDSSDATDGALESTFDLLLDQDAPKLRQAAKARLAAGNPTPDSALGWVKAVANGGPEATVAELIKLGLLPAGATAQGLRPMDDAFDAMRVNYRAMYGHQAHPRGEDPWFFLQRLVWLSGLDGVVIDIDEDDRADLGLVVAGTRYGVRLADTHGGGIDSLRAQVGLVNRVARQTGAQRRILFRTYESHSVLVAASPEALAAGVSAGWLPPPRPSAAHWKYERISYSLFSTSSDGTPDD